MSWIEAAKETIKSIIPNWHAIFHRLSDRFQSPCDVIKRRCEVKSVGQTTRRVRAWKVKKIKRNKNLKDFFWNKNDQFFLEKRNIIWDRMWKTLKKVVKVIPTSLKYNLELNATCNLRMCWHSKIALLYHPLDIDVEGEYLYPQNIDIGCSKGNLEVRI